jgi:hypothetical protein
MMVMQSQRMQELRSERQRQSRTGQCHSGKLAREPAGFDPASCTLPPKEGRGQPIEAVPLYWYDPATATRVANPTSAVTKKWWSLVRPAYDPRI